MAKNRRFEDDTGPWLGVRHLQCLLIFIGLCITFAMRINLSVGIVAMTDRTNSTSSFETFDWDEKIKSYLLGSFFWGYIWTQIPGGYLAEKFGAKYLLLFAATFTSIANIFLPMCASFGGWKLLFLSRMLQGFSQGSVFPSCHVLLSKWCPPEERGVLASFALAGPPYGTVTILASSGIIASVLGWPSIFYISGLAGFIWAIIWLIFGASSPAQCKTISVEERLYIENSLGNVSEEPRLPLPLKDVFTSIPFWSLALTHCANNWGAWTLLTQIPSYMRGVLGVDIKQNALLSSLPYLGTSISSMIIVAIAKYLEKKQCLSTEVTRKLFNTISQWVPTIALLCLGYVRQDQILLAVILLIMATSCNAALILGFHVNHIDIAPNYAGTLMGITNFFANIMGILAPMTVGFIVTDESDPIQWRMIFIIAAGLSFFGNLVFLIFGTTKVQHWNSPKTKEENSKETEYVAMKTDPISQPDD